jgi:mannan endo-1,4-beta-mannosidase
VTARVASVILALAAAAAVVAFAFTRPPARTVLVTPAHLASVKPLRYLGVVSSQLPEFDKAIGRHVNLTGHFVSWGQPLPLAALADTAQLGAGALIELEPRTPGHVPVSLASIAAGHQDSYLRSLARQLATAHAPVMVSFAPEANGNWYSWSGHGAAAAQFVAAWRHVHQVLGSRGARLTWVWQLATGFPGSVPLPRLWPGSAYVDVVGLDGYYAKAGETFASIFTPNIAAIRRVTNRPVLLSEVAVGPTSQPAASIRNLFAGIRQYHLLGLVWFDEDQHGGLYRQDWRLEDDPAALAAFRRAVSRRGISGT